MKLAKLICIGTLALAGCSSTPHGYFDMSYVPQRTDDKLKINQVKIEINIDLETKINKELITHIGGTTRTYADTDLLPYLNPERQEYEIYGKIIYDNIELYAQHECSHPVKNIEKWIYDSKNKEQAYINHDSKTEIGVKYRW